MTTQTFGALIDCFSAELAHRLEEKPPQISQQVHFIDQIESASDLLSRSGIGSLLDASEDLDDAATCLTEALTGDAAEKQVFLGRARTHLRDAIDSL